jgi:pyruvate dehydrogenase E2 component (dihydrolipoamide acetyltransferase)
VPPAIGSRRFTEAPLSATRRVTATRLQNAKQTIPHFYLQIECCVDALLGMRDEMRSQGTSRPTVTDFVVRASALALRKVPLANSAWVDDTLRVYEDADIAVAVKTPAGLITPIVRAANDKDVPHISRELRGLIDRARENRLKSEEYIGGTFTVSNLGMYGVSSLYAIINPPQSGILGVGAVEQRPVVRDGRIGIHSMMTCTLSADHRALDGATGAEFLGELRRLLENPRVW